MSERELRWYSFERDRVPEAVFGFYEPENPGTLEVNLRSLDSGKVAIGFCEATRPGARRSQFPALIVLGESNESDILSWMNTYAPETFPLSQFARVVSSLDWSRLRQPSVQFDLLRADRWACVTLGEVLANGESDGELASLPLSRAAACFSTAMARTVLVHGDDVAIKLCADRLRSLEADRRFVRRAVSVSDLLPIWAILGAGLDDTNEATLVAQMVVDAATHHRAASGATSRIAEGSLREHRKGFASDSVEERVRTFHSLAKSLNVLSRNEAMRSSTDVVLAAGAFLVGRGTTHAFLLGKSVNAPPSSFVWLGLMAALTGPRCWRRGTALGPAQNRPSDAQTNQ